MSRLTFPEPTQVISVVIGWRDGEPITTELKVFVGVDPPRYTQEATA